VLQIVDILLLIAFFIVFGLQNTNDDEKRIIIQGVINKTYKEKFKPPI
jgi:hypothetical protein